MYRHGANLLAVSTPAMAWLPWSSFYNLTHTAHRTIWKSKYNVTRITKSSITSHLGRIAGFEYHLGIGKVGNAHYIHRTNTT
jgi:hypothetical protein